MRCRLLESIDLLVVFASIIVFVLALTATSGSLAKNIVIVARVMRVLRLIKAIRRIHYLLRSSKGRSVSAGRSQGEGRNGTEDVGLITVTTQAAVWV